MLSTGFIREVYYPDWLANVALVKKVNGKWRIFPLPRINQLVDSTSGYKLLTLIDAFSGYNQIKMVEEDHEKTAFITSQ